MYCKADIIENTAVGADVMRMTFAAPDIAKVCEPGQFVMLKAWEGDVPFLMRPFSINSADAQAGTIDLLYKVVGEGTELMQRRTAGGTVTVLGPLGHGFPIDKSYKRIGVIGRGIGIAPMRFLVERAAQMGIECHVYISGKNESSIFNQADFEANGAIVTTTCDNNIMVTSFLEKELENKAFDAVYACGSKRLMRDLARLSTQFGFKAYVSLEEHMACGVGACKGCACLAFDENGEQKYVYVCQCGPVFPIERIVNDV